MVLGLADVVRMVEFTSSVRQAVNAAGHPEVDHVELFGPALDTANHSRNFVLCPGGAYDRSPCGTGTSAKIACLAADGALDEGEIWNQEGILGTRFQGKFEWIDRVRGTIRPRIRGRAFIMAEASLVQDADDPFGWGIEGMAPGRAGGRHDA